MMAIILMISFIALLSLLMIMFASVISKKSYLNREKSSPFECGFDPFSTSRIPFSLRFFMITIIFLIFDAEIAILLPLPIIMKLANTLLWTLMASFLMITLILGLLHEWNFGSLDWTQ